MIWDNLGYYWTMLFNEVKFTIKKKWKYNLKLFLKDFWSLSFEFLLPQVLEIFFIPPFFDKYYIWAFVAMTLVIIIFYLQAIILYEIRKRYFK